MNKGGVRKVEHKDLPSFGDRVKIIRITETDYPTGKGLKEIHGVFLGKFPNNPDLISVKLDNGYNIVIDPSSVVKVEIQSVKRNGSKELQKRREPSDRPLVKLLQTGGTIASKVDYETGAVRPANRESDFLDFAPNITNICDIESRVIMSHLSEDITPEHWMEIAKHIVDSFNEGFRGIVISHGTDTLAYTSAALSVILKDIPGPVVLVGSQRSSDRPSSDAKMNLMGAVRLCAKGDLSGVFVVMHGSVSDDITLIHRGTEVTKLHTSRRDAFHSVNSPPLGYIKDGKIHLEGDHERLDFEKNSFFDPNLEGNVCLIKYHPGLSPLDIDNFSRGKIGILMEGTGLGHVRSEIIESLNNKIENGIPVVVTSQCVFGKCDLKVYSTGRRMLESKIIDSGSLTTETTLVLMMHILGKIQRDKEPAKIVDDFIMYFREMRDKYEPPFNSLEGYGPQYFQLLEKWRASDG